MAGMSLKRFQDIWGRSSLRERQGSQTHFNDLCDLLRESKPAHSDLEGTWYCFDKGAKQPDGSDGWADVWKKDHFAWEYKGRHGSLDAALTQRHRYRDHLGNPPLLVVSDMETIRIHTNWTYTIPQVYKITLPDLSLPPKRELLKWVFSDPEKLHPGIHRARVTEEVAKQFAELAQRLRDRGHSAHHVAHFIHRVLFCFFAQDVGLMEDSLFTELVESSKNSPDRFLSRASSLFRVMATGGDFGLTNVNWFNGGLFDDDLALPLESDDIKLLLEISNRDWSQIEPSVFGTLFERGLDPDKRSQLGAHYTDSKSILRIIGPVVIEPLRKEWEVIKRRIESRLQKLPARDSQGRVPQRHRRKEQELRTAIEYDYHSFAQRLEHFNVLDPACGSGNFLYLSLLGLKDLEAQVSRDAERLGLEPLVPVVTPHVLHGIEINPYAAELARVTIWIGQIQWNLNQGFGYSDRPILMPLNQIDCRDALIANIQEESEWPEAECIVGNPPFLGDKKIIGVLGEEYANRLRSLFRGRIPAGADLCSYWFEKARAHIKAGKARRAGLVATSSIRGGMNRRILERIQRDLVVYDAWQDEEWAVDGAAVNVSLVCFAVLGDDAAKSVRVDGKPTSAIYGNLAPSHVKGVYQPDLTQARRLSENKGVAFIGTQKNGPFDVRGDLARQWLRVSGNPNGRPNSDVLRPWANGLDVLRRPSDRWIIDFGEDMNKSEAAQYEEPFRHVYEIVRPSRMGNRDKFRLEQWWLHGRTGATIRAALSGLDRFIVTPRVAQRRIFAWMPSPTYPDCQLVVIARSDDVTMGILHSRIHRVWALRMGTALEDRPRYTPTSTFETFPFPPGMVPNTPVARQGRQHHAEAIRHAVAELMGKRERWLNPAEWVDLASEAIPGYPVRIIPRPGHERDLNQRTLTRLYSEDPPWLRDAHQSLDLVVSAAYGWSANLSDNEILARLLELNHARDPL